MNTDLMNIFSDSLLLLTSDHLRCLLHVKINVFIFNDNNNNNCIERRSSRFLTISSLRRELSPTRTLKWPRRNRMQRTCKTSSAYHVQHVMCHLFALSEPAVPTKSVDEQDKGLVLLEENSSMPHEHLLQKCYQVLQAAANKHNPFPDLCSSRPA